MIDSQVPAQDWIHIIGIPSCFHWDHACSIWTDSSKLLLPVFFASHSEHAGGLMVVLS
jgi:hypothetical protein